MEDSLLKMCERSEYQKSKLPSWGLQSFLENGMQQCDLIGVK